VFICWQAGIQWNVLPSSECDIISLALCLVPNYAVISLFSSVKSYVMRASALCLLDSVLVVLGQSLWGVSNAHVAIIGLFDPGLLIAVHPSS